MAEPPQTFQRRGRVESPPFVRVPETVEATPFLDRARDALRLKQPPRDDGSMPDIDDDVDVLLEQVSVNEGHVHASSDDSVAG